MALGLVVGLIVSCGDETPDPAEESPEVTEPAVAAGPLVDEDGALAEGDAADDRGRYDRYFVNVGVDDRILVTLTSTEFDPILEVTPPSSGTLVNDDWEGDRTRSQIELITSAAGQLKLEVRAYGDDADGAYELIARRVNDDDDAEPAVDVPVLTAGQTHDGEITDTDHPLSDGERFDSLVIQARSGVSIAVSGRDAPTPRTTLVGPDGLSLEPSDGRYEAPREGSYRLQVIGAPGVSYRVAVTAAEGALAPLFARAHHQFNQLLGQLGGGGGNAPAATNRPRPGTNPTANPPTPSTDPPRALPVRVGDRLNGNLSDNDATLPSGERYDIYELTVSEPQGPVVVEMESERVDCFLRVDGPNGQHWENDDFGGTLNSRVEIPLGEAGTYRIVTTSYAAGETGPYELKVLTARDAPAGGAAGGPEQTIAGELAQGDNTLSSGELMDEHRFTWPAGARVHLEAQSTDFDTYLIAHPPSGPQQDNDDMVPGQTLNAGMDLQVTEAGEWRIVVTSYRPGETGRYNLVVRGGASGGTAPTPTPTPTPAVGSGGGTPHVIEGNLAQGDSTLRSGELMDTHTLSFTARNAVSIRLESSEFDTYLIVHSPSGNQEDNDDFQSGSLNSGFDIQVAEPGDYRIVVTSYRPGETGRYRLTVTEGPSIVSPNPATGGGTPAAAGSGGRVWGLFAGITDYPGSTNDLPECANDARKLAEAVRNQGNMPPEQEFLLTDAQATTGAIRQAMQTVAQRIQPSDVFVFFYSDTAARPTAATTRASSTGATSTCSSTTASSWTTRWASSSTASTHASPWSPSTRASRAALAKTSSRSRGAWACSPPRRTSRALSRGAFRRADTSHTSCAWASAAKRTTTRTTRSSPLAS